MSHAPVLDVATAERALVDLLALERELLELEYVRRADALERVSEAVRRLGEQGTSEGLLTRAAAELVAGSAFDRVLVSEVVDGRLVPLAIAGGADQAAADAALRELGETVIRLEYPLLEYEVARGHEPEVVSVADAGARTPTPLARSLRWTSTRSRRWWSAAPPSGCCTRTPPAAAGRWTPSTVRWRAASPRNWRGMRARRAAPHARAAPR